MKRHCGFLNMIPYPGQWAKMLTGCLKTCLAFLFILFSANSFAQVTLPPSDIDCPSKDLEVTRAILPAPASDPCSCSGTRILQLGIINKTGSDRTSFAMWGKLIRKDASGNPIGTPEAIFACATGIKASSTNFYPTTTSITVACNQSLEIVDVILAWTSANKKETCDVLYNSPSTINPKCGRVDAIRIETGVDADFIITNATCTSGGSVQVSPFGGIAPFRVKIGTDERTNISAGGSTTFSNLAAGSHDIVITDSRNCSVTKTRTIGSTAAPTANAGDDFTKTCIANASGGNIGEVETTGHSYFWTSSPAGFTSSLANPTVNPSVTTTYTVRKTNLATGCFDDDDVTVAVNTMPPTANAGTDFTKTCVANTDGGSIGETTTAGFNYSWTSSPAGFNSSVANPTVNPSATTTYTVRKTNTTTGCFDDDDVTVTVDNAAVTANAGADFTKTCVANTSGGIVGEAAEAGFSYSWTSSPVGFTSALSNPTVNPSATTSYTVRKTNTTTGCFDDDDVTVTVDNAAVTADAGADFPKTCIANTDGSSIGETAAVGFNYSWTSLPAGFTSALANPTVNPSATTTYTVRKTNSTTGCFDDDEVTVTVSNAAVTANAGDDFIKTCVANTSGKAVGEAAVAGYSHSWTSSPAGFTSALANPPVNPLVTTTFTVRKTDLATGCFDDDEVLVTVNNTTPTFTVCLVQPTLCANSGSVTINATGGSGFTYSINNGINWSSNNVFSNLGSGSVTGIKVMNSDGCVSGVANCEASDCPAETSERPQTTNSTQTIAATTINIAEKPVDQLTVKAFPNPYNDKVRLVVSSPVTGYGSIEVVNMLGQKIKTVYQGHIVAGSQTFDMSVPPAQRSTLIYILRMGGKQITGKILQLNQ